MNVLIGYNPFTLPKYKERLKTILSIYRIWLFYFILRIWFVSINKSLHLLFTSWARLVRHAQTKTNWIRTKSLKTSSIIITKDF